MKLLKVDTIEQAREKILNHCKSWLLKTETVALDEAQDRILAQDILSPCDIPSFRRSTVDGYAVIASDTAGAGESIPVFLKYNGSVSMGELADMTVCHGECVYVPTGGMVPDGANAVVMIEYCEQADDVVAVCEAVAHGTGLTHVGEDFQSGKLLLAKGAIIRAQEIGALCAAGITSVCVFTPLAIAIISTGDELINSSSSASSANSAFSASLVNNPPSGKIRDINTNAIKALAVKNGFKVVSTQVLADDETLLEREVKKAIAFCDIVIISGGSSKGEKDFTASVIDKVSKPGVFTHGLAVKPGKPTILGWDEESKTLLAGLPGHPVSAMMVFTALLSWLAEKIFHKPPVLSVPARISCNVSSAPGKSVFMPVVLRQENYSYLAEPVFGKAGMISTLTRAVGYIIIDMNKEGLQKDEPVMVTLFK